MNKESIEDAEFIPPMGEIIGVQSFIPSSEYIRKLSVMSIETLEDVNSQRLGVVEWGQACHTCDCFLDDCMGHFGHIDLPIPAYRVFFIHHLIDILSCICFYCQNLRLPKTDKNYNWILSLEPQNRLSHLVHYAKYYKKCGESQELQKSSNYKTCCGKLFINFILEDRDALFIKAIVPLEEKDYDEWKLNPSWQPLQITPQDLFDCLSNISNEAKEMLGIVCDYNEPASTMWDVLPCPSHNTRPSHTFSNVGVKKKSFNDWTKLLRNIVGARNELRKEILKNPTEVINIAWYSVSNIQSKDVSECFSHGYLGKDKRETKKNELKEKNKSRIIGPVEASWRKLNKQIAAFHSAKHKKFANNGNLYGKPPMSIESRFKGQKMGRWRGYITARRVENAMRGVLEGCLHIRPDQVIIPKQRAMLQTFDEYVTKYNLKQVHEWILNGPFIYPGSNFIVLKDGTEIDLMYYENRRDINLNNVLIVKRHLLDGDIGTINRQPTLHKNSIFGLKFLIKPGYVFYLHYSTFHGLGADCDGDEIVVHINQTPQSRAETLSLSMIHHCIMKSGKIWVNFIQNAVVGAYLMTRKDYYLTKDEMIDIVSVIDVWEFPLPYQNNLYTGHSIISLILPKNFTMEYKDVKIYNGKLLCGQLNDDILNGTNGILSNMYRDYEDKEIIIHFIHQGYLLFQKFVENFGVTAGYYDGAIDLKDIEKFSNSNPNQFINNNDKQMSIIFQKMENTKKCVKDLKQYSDSFPNHNPITGSQDLEDNIKHHIDVINKMTCDEINEYHEIKDEKKMNGILHIIKSGAKGSTQTLNAMGGRVTQIYVIYKRFGIISSHFLKGYNTLHSFGFLDENYSNGISLPSAMIEAHAACESVVGKNKGTSKSGYTVRKLTTCMMGIVIDRKRRAVDTNGRVLWNIYGNDGYDSQTLTNVTIRDESNQLKEYKLSKKLKNNEINKKIKLNDNNNNEINKKIKINDNEEMNHLCELHNQIKLCNKTFRAPFKFEHLFLRCLIELKEIKPTILKNEDYYNFIKEYWNYLLKESLVVNSHSLLKLLFFDWMGSENMKFFKFGKEHMIWLGQQIKIYLERAIIQPGESCGTLSTHETGEPFSQMSLKTPHLSGQFRGIFSGTVRIANMVDGKFTNPTMSIVLKSSIKTKQDATLFGLSILRCKLHDLSKSFPTCEIFNDFIRLKFILDKNLTILRAISLREIARNLAMNTNLELSSFKTSFANDDEYFLQVDIHFYSYLWTSLVKQDTHLKKLDANIKLLANVIAYNFYCNIYIHGFPTIENFVIQEINIKNSKRFMITTLGSNLAKILSIQGVDVKRTTCNDCSEVCNVLGVQAARKSLENEFSLVFKNTTDTRHIKLISRMMASDLEIKGMKLKQAAKSIPMLQRAAFEQGPKTMSEYCALAEYDPSYTVCGAALSNKLINVGTGYSMDIILQDVKIPININNKKIENVCDYIFSFKVDGLRLILTFLHDRNGKKLCNFQDRNGCIYTLPLGGINNDSLFEGTVLDGDLTYVIKNGKLTNELCYVVHDIYLSCGNICSYLRYDQRIEIAREIIYHIGTFGLSSNLKDAPNFTKIEMGTNLNFCLPISLRSLISKSMFRIGNFGFNITVKPLFDIRGLQIFHEYISNSLSFPIDGYILTSLSLGATPFTTNEKLIYKIKPIHTIDVILCKSLNNLKYAKIDNNEIKSYRISNGQYYMCAINNYSKSNEMAIFSTLNTNQLIEEYSCYECLWKDNQWEILKKRDKQANTMKTIVKTINNIIENLQLKEIISLIK